MYNGSREKNGRKLECHVYFTITHVFQINDVTTWRLRAIAMWWQQWIIPTHTPEEKKRKTTINPYFTGGTRLIPVYNVANALRAAAELKPAYPSSNPRPRRLGILGARYKFVDANWNDKKCISSYRGKMKSPFTPLSRYGHAKSKKQDDVNVSWNVGFNTTIWGAGHGAFQNRVPAGGRPPPRPRPPPQSTISTFMSGCDILCFFSRTNFRSHEARNRL